MRDEEGDFVSVSDTDSLQDVTAPLTNALVKVFVFEGTTAPTSVDALAHQLENTTLKLMQSRIWGYNLAAKVAVF